MSDAWAARPADAACPRRLRTDGPAALRAHV